MDIKQSLSSCANDARSEEDAMIIMQAVRRIKELESGLVAAQERNVDYEADIVTRRLDYTEDCKRLDARIEELELRIADESRACALFQSHIRELEAQLTAAKERGRTLNDELYYACELAIAYAHSEKDKEWAAKRIEELMPPEQEVADESL